MRTALLAPPTSKLAAMGLWDVATEQDEGQMWEEARAIASRILAACRTT